MAEDTMHEKTNQYGQCFIPCLPPETIRGNISFNRTIPEKRSLWRFHAAFPS